MTPSNQTPLQPIFPASFNLKIIGLGGIGSIAAENVALWLCAQSVQHPQTSFRIVLIDGDEFETHNARMFFGRLGPKATVKCEDLHEKLGDRIGRLSIEAVDEYVTDENIGRLIHEGDFVLLCVDSHASRKLVSDFFEENIRDGALISAGNDGVGKDSTGEVRTGTYGNCQVFIRRDGVNVTPSLTQYHPEIASPADKLPTHKGCTDDLASVPQLHVTNMQAATAMYASLYLTLCGDEALPWFELAFDIALGKMTALERPRGGQVHQHETVSMSE